MNLKHLEVCQRKGNLQDRPLFLELMAPCCALECAVLGNFKFVDIVTNVIHKESLPCLKDILKINLPKVKTMPLHTWIKHKGINAKADKKFSNFVFNKFVVNVYVALNTAFMLRYI